MDSVRGLFPRLTPRLRVSTEFHRLVTDVEDAWQKLFKVPDGDRQGYLDAYAALSQRKRELYEYVAKTSPPPRPLYAVTLAF